jgi:hypothetical protein
MKYIHIKVTFQWLQMVFREKQEYHLRIKEGLPSDAQLIHMEQCYNDQMLHMFFTSETVGVELPEGSMLMSLPATDIVFQDTWSEVDNLIKSKVDLQQQVADLQKELGVRK